MYEYNQTNMAQANIENQTVPNVMIDDSRDYGEPQAEAPPADIGQIKVPIDGTNALPLYTVNGEVPQFEIPDTLVRRAFVRKLFTILLFQNIFILPIIETFLLCTDEPIDIKVYVSLRLLEIIIYSLMYVFSDFRRYSPVNILCFIVVTVLRGCSDGVYATQFLNGNHTVLLGHLTVVVQLLVLIAYSKQNRFKFSNFNVIMLMILIIIIVTIIIEILFRKDYWVSVSGSIYLMACYYVYDIQLMLTGHHGYNLNPEEHIFAATNIYADIPNLMWRLFRYIVLDHFIRLYRFLRSCCFSEVC